MTAASCRRAACWPSTSSQPMASLAEGLRVEPGEPVVRFTRLRLGSGEPMAVETIWIASALVPGLAPADLDGSLYELLARRYRLAPGSARVTIEPVLPDPATRRHLGIPARQACLRLRMTDADTRGRVMMIADCIYRGDRYQLSANVPGGTTPRAPGEAARLMHILAVDGGQSAIRLRHSSSDRVVEVRGVSPARGRHRGHGGVRDRPGVAGRAGSARVTGPCWGCPRRRPTGASQDRLCRHVNRVIGADEVWLADDSVTCHAGALSLGWGVSITAGTGVACLVVPETGEPSVLSGHGYLLGDEGGAFWIGREGLRAALRAADGRGPSTALVDAAARRFAGLRDLAIRIHSAVRPVNDIAHFAPDVLAVADAGDAVADGDRGRRPPTELLILVRAAVEVAGRGSTEGAHRAGRARWPAPGRGPARCGDASTAGSRARRWVRRSGPRMAPRSMARSRWVPSGDPGRYRSWCTCRGSWPPRHRVARRERSRCLRPAGATSPSPPTWWRGSRATEWPRIAAAADLLTEAIASGAHGPRLRERSLPHARGGAVLPGRRPGAGATHPVRGADAPWQRHPGHDARAAAGTRGGTARRSSDGPR